MVITAGRLQTEGQPRTAKAQQRGSLVGWGDSQYQRELLKPQAYVPGGAQAGNKPLKVCFHKLEKKQDHQIRVAKARRRKWPKPTRY